MDTHRFQKYGIAVPDILIPAKGIGLTAWAVIACDQYTQDKAYWERAKKIREGKPSTLSLILPEAYLDQKDSHVPAIHAAMAEYLRGGVFAPPVSAPFYIERVTEFGRIRRGLLAAIDLDAYDWNPQKKALIRATEATVIERIPPRMDIRRGAPLEVPHVMLLVNDPERRLVESCAGFVKTHGIPPAYDAELMQGAGRVTGYALAGEAPLALLEAALGEIARANSETDGSVFLFAAGDGNHSLASAKAVWEEIKNQEGESLPPRLRQAPPVAAIPPSPGDRRSAKDGSAEDFSRVLRKQNSKGWNDTDAVSAKDGSAEDFSRVLRKQNSKGWNDMDVIPARYSLCEIVNIYDEGLTFEPIHRVLFNARAEDVIALIAARLSGKLTPCRSREELIARVENSARTFGFAHNGTFAALDSPFDGFAVNALQPVLDAYLAAHTEVSIDYIHGAEDLFKLARQNDTLAIMMPSIKKDSFFSAIAQTGVLPRKSFSMGEASEKRFYFECRKLFA